MDRTVVFNGALLRIGSANRAGLRPISGSADHVYVFAFQSGKPSVALSTATKSLIQVIGTAPASGRTCRQQSDLPVYARALQRGGFRIPAEAEAEERVPGRVPRATK